MLVGDASEGRMAVQKSRTKATRKMDMYMPIMTVMNLIDLGSKLVS